MTKEKLLQFSVEALVEMAEEEGISVVQGTPKETIVEQLLDAIEEDQSEREMGNNPLMRVVETKYDLVVEAPLPQEWDKFPLLSNYNETYIRMILRDPLWAFAYWEVKESDLARLNAESGVGDLLLRVHELAGSPGSDGKGIDYFDIPVRACDSSWYFNLPNLGCTYRIELVCRRAGSERTLCRSNSVASPSETFDQLLKPEKRIADSGNDFVLLSGLYDFEAPSSQNTIPQRIIGFLDAQYIQFKD